jgi:hypothetical protein
VGDVVPLVSATVASVTGENEAPLVAETVLNNELVIASVPLVSDASVFGAEVTMTVEDPLVPIVDGVAISEVPVELSLVCIEPGVTVIDVGAGVLVDV